MNSTWWQVKLTASRAKSTARIFLADYFRCFFGLVNNITNNNHHNHGKAGWLFCLICDTLMSGIVRGSLNYLEYCWFYLIKSAVNCNKGSSEIPLRSLTLMTEDFIMMVRAPSWLAVTWSSRTTPRRSTAGWPSCSIGRSWTIIIIIHSQLIWHLITD